MENHDKAAEICRLLGFDSPNEMQRRVGAVEPLPERLRLLAPTGTGKTAAVAIYLARCPRGRAVVIAPSRELVLQLREVFAKALAPLKTAALYGGHPFQWERDALAAEPDVVVATPGRLLDHLQRSTPGIAGIRPEALVFDEYDKILELGFRGETDRILRRLGRLPHMLLCSATVTDELPAGWGRGEDAVTVDVRDEEQKGRDCRLEVVAVRSDAADKISTLVSLLRVTGPARSLVFVNHRESADRLYAALRKEGLPVGIYHGGLDQKDRQTALDLFANGTTPLLVTTDLASRGLDVKEIENIIHYHLPADAETWIHRNGRTGRQSAAGRVIAILNDKDKKPDEAVMITVDELRREGDRPRPMRSLYVDAGRRQKISRGDILGMLTRSLGVDPGAVGAITVHDDHSVVAVRPEALAVLAPLMRKGTADARAKGKRVRLSEIKT